MTNGWAAVISQDVDPANPGNLLVNFTAMRTLARPPANFSLRPEAGRHFEIYSSNPCFVK